VCLIAASSLSSGLFTNILIESGACNGPWGPGESIYGLVNGEKFLYSLNATTISDLRALPLSSLMASPYWHLFPSIDDHFLNRSPLEIYASGNSQIPPSGHILIGTNTLDTLFGYPFYNGPFPTDNSTFYTLLIEFFGVNDAPAIFNVYPGTPSPKIAFQRINAHLCLTCPTRTLVKNLIADAYNYTYLYEFGFNPMNPHLAGHGADIPLVFGMPLSVWPFNSTLSGVMIDYFSSFIVNGIPVSNIPVLWPVYGHGNQMIDLDIEISVLFGVNDEECNFWQNYAEQSPGNGLKMIEYCYLTPNLRK